MPSFSQRPGMAPSRDRAHQIVQPLPEHVAGDNNPYRGTENHGVIPNAKPEDHPDHWAEEPVPHGVVEHEIPEPVRVVIVNKASKEIKDWRATRATVGGDNPNAKNIVARNDQRTALVMKNLGLVTVYLGNDSGLTAGMGYPLVAGETSRTFLTTQDVYGVSADGTMCEIAVLFEFTITVGGEHHT